MQGSSACAEMNDGIDKNAWPDFICDIFYTHAPVVLE